MSTLQSLFSDSIQSHIEPNTKLVLALSGGVDSRVLLDLLADYVQTHPSQPCLAVHVHHGLSANADEWAQRCETWCQERAIPFTLEKVSLEVKSRTSIESVAREARYQALSKHVDSDDVLLVGQHLDDQLETFLLALKRGSGPKGLSAMARVMPFGNGKLLRPLLNARRSDIESYAQKQKLLWVEDESNTDTRFDRNFLRHEVAPRLTERWQQFPQAVQRSAELCAEQEMLLDELLTPTYRELVSSDGSLDIRHFGSFSLPKKHRLIRMWFEEQGCSMPSRTQLTEICENVIDASKDASPKLLINNKELRRYERKIYLLDTTVDVSDWCSSIRLGEKLTLPDGLGELSLVCRTSISGESAPEDVQIFSLPNDIKELVITFEPQGLSACPEGRSGSRKLKKLFQEYSIPPWQRRRTPIVKLEGEVVAVASLFVAKPYSGQEIALIWRR